MPEAFSSPIHACRLCGSLQLDPLLDLGAQPPANSLRTQLESPLPNVPLALCRCRDCTVVQLTETIHPEHLFRDYIWVTGTSSTALAYSEVFRDRFLERMGAPSGLIVEVASNDGTFLRPFLARGFQVLGVDPALNLAREAERTGIPTVAEFFNLEIAQRIARDHGQAEGLMARNVLPHTPDPNALVAGMAHLLKPSGLGAIEFHWVDRILTELHYDSIYHEHFFYHTLESVGRLLHRHGLHPFDVQESPISGGSLVVYFSKEARPQTEAYTAKLAVEAAHGLSTLAAWQDFSARAVAHREALKALVDREVAAGHRVIGYGASARSSTLLNFCGINHRHLACVADQSPHKHGRFTPGTDIPIIPPEEALATRPDTVLLLAWNFETEIRQRLRELGFKGHLLLPLPGSPKLVAFPE